MRLIAAALTVILCSIIGFLRSCRIEERLSLINYLLSDIRKLSIQLEFTSDPIVIIMDKIKASSKVREIWDGMMFYINEGMGCKDAWQKVACERDGVLCALEEEERAELQAFFDALGTSDIDSEKKNAAHTYKLLEDIKTRLEKDTEKKKSIYRRLGPLVGIAFAILII